MLIVSLLVYQVVSNDSLVVKLANGQGVVQGSVVKESVRQFLGIPYAKPPIGSLRFQEPSYPPNPLPSSPYPALNFGKSCIQGISALYNTTFENMDENCLFLNVFTPIPSSKKKNDEQKWPVMVWIYGGAFVTGTSNIYDGFQIVNNTQNTIVVTINYRLNIFGYLGHDLLRTSTSPSTGNYAVLDAITALKWVKDNIEFFGGDASRVTVFGESAGGITTNLLLVSSLLQKSEPLFSRAIIQSGVISDLILAPVSMKQQLTEDFFKNLGCPIDKSTLECVQKKSIVEILIALKLNPAVFQTSIPTIDGVVFDKDIWTSFSENSFIQNGSIPVIVGNVAQEFGSIVCGKFGSNMTMEQVATALSATCKPNIVQDALSKYVAWYPEDSPKDIYVRILSQRVWQCPTRKFALSYSKNDFSNIWFYTVDHLLDALAKSGRSSWSCQGSSHATELVYEFPTSFLPIYSRITRNPLNFTNDEQDLSDRMIKLWTNLAATGNPNYSGTDSVRSLLKKKVQCSIGKENCFYWPNFESVAEKDLLMSIPYFAERPAFYQTPCEYWETIPISDCNFVFGQQPH